MDPGRSLLARNAAAKPSVFELMRSAQPATPATPAGGPHFRCDVYAPSSTKQRETEDECQEKIVQAGGRIMNEVMYPAGFLYDMQGEANGNPLGDGYVIGSDWKVVVAPWTPFPAPKFNPLRMNPPGGFVDRMSHSKNDVEAMDRGQRDSRLHAKVGKWLGRFGEKGQENPIYEVTRSESSSSEGAHDTVIDKNESNGDHESDKEHKVYDEVEGKESHGDDEGKKDEAPA